MGNEPKNKFRVGGMSIAIWENENDGKKTQSAKIQKTFTKDNGKTWENTDTLFLSDLQDLKRLVDKSIEVMRPCSE